MEANHVTAVAEAFSRKASLYDAFGADHPNLMHMRQKVRRHALLFLRPGTRILELNAGTGVDAVFFAELGYRVHATDISPGMMAEIHQKIAGLGLKDRLTAQRCSFEALDLVEGGPYDYVFSNMGGMNCSSDLNQVAQGVNKVLLPGGRVTWVVMPPICLWELTQALHGDFRTATRRLRRGGILANVEGVQFLTRYFTPKQVCNAFGKGFRKLRLEGLSVITPPADHKAFPVHHPRLYHILRILDDWVAGRYPFNRWGDFYILTLEKTRIPDLEA